MTGAEVQTGPVILIGYEYRLQLQAEADLFPDAAHFAGQMRAAVADTTVLASLTTANRGLLRRDDRTLEIVLSPEVTAGLMPGRVVLDIVRTDPDPDQHLGVLLDIPVALPVTRGL